MKSVCVVVVVEVNPPTEDALRRLAARFIRAAMEVSPVGRMRRSQIPFGAGVLHRRVKTTGSARLLLIEGLTGLFDSLPYAECARRLGVPFFCQLFLGKQEKLGRGAGDAMPLLVN
jgi:hypothetical protein